MNPFSADGVETAGFFEGAEEAEEDEEGRHESPGPLADVISMAVESNGRMRMRRR